MGKTTREKEELDTHQKALRLNLNPHIYGSCAEIGAGQEVAAWFFRVGGASGTIAKTISAYDMKVSDEIYGKTGRYVSRDRLVSMLGREYHELESRLREIRGKDSMFFVFADTVSARNFSGSNICHGWMGIQFQSAPTTEASRIMLHVNMQDESNVAQQEALGILGVNLIYGAYFYSDHLDRLMETLLDGLTLDRIEIDLLEPAGPLFSLSDSWKTNLQLLTKRVGRAVVFSPDGIPIAPIDVLYKRPVVIERGRFFDVELIHEQLLQTGLKYLEKERKEELTKDPVGLPEITLQVPESNEQVGEMELRERISKFTSLGYPIMVSSIPETFRLTGYLNRYTQAPIRYISGIGNLMRILESRFYQQLEAGILTAISRWMTSSAKLYVCEQEVQSLREELVQVGFDLSLWKLPESGMAGLANTSPKGSLRHLYFYLIESGAFIPVQVKTLPR